MAGGPLSGIFDGSNARNRSSRILENQPVESAVGFGRLHRAAVGQGRSFDFVSESLTIWPYPAGGARTDLKFYTSFPQPCTQLRLPVVG